MSNDSQNKDGSGWKGKDSGKSDLLSSDTPLDVSGYGKSPLSKNEGETLDVVGGDGGAEIVEILPSHVDPDDLDPDEVRVIQKAPAFADKGFVKLGEATGVSNERVSKILGEYAPKLSDRVRARPADISSGKISEEMCADIRRNLVGGASSNELADDIGVTSPAILSHAKGKCSHDRPEGVSNTTYERGVGWVFVDGSGEDTGTDAGADTEESPETPDSPSEPDSGGKDDSADERSPAAAQAGSNRPDAGVVLGVDEYHLLDADGEPLCTTVETDSNRYIRSFAEDVCRTLSVCPACEFRESQPDKLDRSGMIRHLAGLGESETASFSETETLRLIDRLMALADADADDPETES